MRIVFVCTGNTCRSPLAEGLGKQILGPEVQVESAGLAAWEGESASAQTAQVLKEKGIDFTSHKARLINEQIIASADWVIPMTKAHEMQLKGAFPAYSAKIKRLSLWDNKGNSQDIQDPWGRSVDIYRQCAGEIEFLLNKVRAKLEANSFFHE